MTHPRAVLAMLAFLVAAPLGALADDPPAGATPAPEQAKPDDKPAAPPPAPAKPDEQPAVPPAAPAEKPAAEQPAERSASTVVGQRIRVRLKHGGSIEGVVLASGTWELRDLKAGWMTSRRGVKGAGIRLWWVQELDGFQFVVEGEIAEMTILGPVTEEELKELQRRAQEAKAAAERERLRVIAERAAQADAEDAARKLIGEVEKAKDDAAAAKARAAEAPAEDSKAQRWAQLLAKYPPGNWTLETPAEIERRKIVLGLFPNEEEKAFLAAFEEWKPAYSAWMKAQNIAKGSPTGRQ